MNRAKRFQGKGRGRDRDRGRNRGGSVDRGKGRVRGQPLSMIAAMKSKSKARNERRLTAQLGSLLHAKKFRSFSNEYPLSLVKTPFL